MPRYDYICPANDCVIEVSHPMSHTVRCWGELCELADMACGETDPKSPVERLVSHATVLTGTRDHAKGEHTRGGTCCGLPGC